MFCGRLTLRKACDTLLSTFSKTEQGLKLLSEHQLYVLWPMTPNLQFTNAILDRPVKRAKMWRSINLELIHLRLTSILTIIRAQAVYRLDAPEFHPLSDIAHDSLEFLRWALSAVLLSCSNAFQSFRLVDRHSTQISSAHWSSRHDQYPNTLKTHAFAICMVLIGSRRTEELVHGLTSWPTLYIESFISNIAKAFTHSYQK